MTQRVNMASLEEVFDIHKLAAEQRDRIQNYLRILMKWAAKINLTGAKTERELINLHIADCLQLVPYLPDGTLIDVGAGAGFPSIILSCCEPSRPIHAVEPTHKKIAFLNTVKRELGLGNYTTHACRLEELDAELLPVDIAVSRATWALPEWFNKATSLVRVGGLIIGMEGSERHDLGPSVERHSYRLLDRQRSIVLRRR